jgi:hypothetical protein
MALRKVHAKVLWHGKEVGKEAARKLNVNAMRVGMMLSGEVVRSVSRSQDVRRLASGELRGLDPSKPGERPKMVHGALRASISHRVERHGDEVSVFLGAYTPYARDLEFGVDVSTPGAFMMYPRPYLRPALAENRVRAIRMLVKGVMKQRHVWDRRRKR